MNGRSLSQLWETEYLKAQINMVAEVIRNNDVDAALNCLNMFEGKIKELRYEIGKSKNPMDDIRPVFSKTQKLRSGMVVKVSESPSEDFLGNLAKPSLYEVIEINFDYFIKTRLGKVSKKIFRRAFGYLDNHTRPEFLRLRENRANIIHWIFRFSNFIA